MDYVSATLIILDETVNAIRKFSIISDISSARKDLHDLILLIVFVEFLTSMARLKVNPVVVAILRP